MGAGIFGESFQGMPPRALGTSRRGCAELTCDGRAHAVRAAARSGVSIAAGSRPSVTDRGGVGRQAGVTGRAPGRGRLRQLAAAAEAELVVVLVFFAAAVAGNHRHPRSAYRN